MACEDHLTISSHSYKTPNGRVWICSHCGERQKWGPTWSYYGNYECRVCCVAQIDWVACSDECAQALHRKKRKKKGTRR